ncbi:MAG TPA: zf-HC2 domain-containing protein [Longimicrobiales bacterium]|nr:zf-HC2 domain-containing protein [Longimicrobiales bacterium]
MITHDELMRYLDGELPPERARAVEEAMERSTELRREYMIFSRMKTDLQSLGAEMPQKGSVWEGVSRRIARPVGWLLFVVGALVWTGYAVYTWFTSTGPVWEKLTTGALVVGLAMLLLSALLDRYVDLKTDPYREIER